MGLTASGREHFVHGRFRTWCDQQESGDPGEGLQEALITTARHLSLMLPEKGAREEEEEGEA